VSSEQFDMGSLLEQAQAMQQQLLEAQAQAAEQVVEGQSGGGVVKVRMTGGMELQAVTIDPSAVDPDDVGMLEDLVLAAVNDAVAKAQEASQAVTSQALGGLDLGGLGLPGTTPS
jgi:DNA-binding YbaB/EbfC family protein